jgi:hypothetical protein
MKYELVYLAVDAGLEKFGRRLARSENDLGLAVGRVCNEVGQFPLVVGQVGVHLHRAAKEQF